MTTRGIQFLRDHHIAHQVITYDHMEKGAEFAAKAVDFPLSQTIKTLVVVLDSDRFTLVLMPGDRQLSMKKVARACKAKRAAMADTATAQRLTGYLVGGISPFGTKKRLDTVMDTALSYHQAVVINAGQRGIMAKLAPDDIIAALKAAVAELSQ